MRAMILAAGLGTRLLPHSAWRPKPLFTFAGQPLLDRLLRQLEQAGCTAAMVNTHHLGGAISDFLAGQRYAMPVATRYEPEILGTAGAIRNVADFWAEQSLLLINGDVLSDIDLADLWRNHHAGDAPATLVLHDRREFNHVTLDAGGRIAGFHLPPAQDGTRRRLAFTGIQVLSPRVLPFIPATGSASLIDLYRALIAAGDPPRAHLASGCFWQDIGTPERYRELAADCLTAAAFDRPWPGRSSAAAIVRTKLEGDGSQREWYRLSTGPQSLILADHGIHSPEMIGEVDAFIAIGRHLARCRVPVPRIVAHDAFAGLVALEDLGTQHLEQAVATAGSADDILALYRRVIDCVLAMNRNAGPGFDPAWAYQSTRYSRELILERECRYFLDEFVIGFCGRSQDAIPLAEEFERIAERIATLTVAGWGFMHRDCQSRNFMLRGKEPFFIDFQGGRLGPVHYDLASLIADPYVDLPAVLQERLIDFIAKRSGLEPTALRQGVAWCAVARGLQALGAFGKLVRQPHKGRFRNHIPAGLRQLNRSLERLGPDELPRLRALARSLSTAIPMAKEESCPPSL